MKTKDSAEMFKPADENQISEIEAEIPRERLIYKKRKNVEIFVTPQKKYIVDASFGDARHEMRILTKFSNTRLEIENLVCQMIRYPHEECIQAESALKVMIGNRVQPGMVNDLKKSVGNRGCTHLNNLFQEVCYTVIQGQGTFARAELGRVFKGISEEQIYKIFIMFKPDMIDSCVCYSKDSHFLQSIEKASLPKGAEHLKPIK